MAREHAAFMARCDCFDRDHERHLSRIAALDASIEKSRRDIQRFNARIARARGRTPWRRKFSGIARRVAADRLSAAGNRAIGLRMRRTSRVPRACRSHARHVHARASGDDPSAVPIAAAAPRKAVSL